MIKIFITFLSYILIFFNTNLLSDENIDKIKIGLLAPFSGEYKYLGNSLLLSTQLALSEIGDNKIVIIPMEGMVASLNVSVAAALILYEAQRQRKEAKLYQESRLSQEEYDATLFEWAHPEIAERCQNQNIPYPKLNDDGSLAENPFKKN